MAALEIRPAKPSDIHEIRRLILELAADEAFPFPVTVTTEELERNLFGSPPAAEALLAFSEEELAGFAVFYETFATTTGRRGLHLDDLYIRRAYQGKGYGRMLLQYLAKIAIKRQCARFEWWALKTNAHAIEFFGHIGARRMDEMVIFRIAGQQLDELASGGK